MVHLPQNGTIGFDPQPNRKVAILRAISILRSGLLAEPQAQAALRQVGRIKFYTGHVVGGCPEEDLSARLLQPINMEPDWGSL